MVLAAIAPLRSMLAEGDDSSKSPVPISTSTPAIELPNELPGGAWRARGNARVLSADQFAVVDGAEVFLEYGLEHVIARRYLKGSSAVTVEAFEMHFPSGAYGLLATNRRTLPSHRSEFTAGRYLVSVSMDNILVPVSADALAAAKELFSGQSAAEAPPLVSHLPSQNKVEGSERYLVGPEALKRVDGFALLAEHVDFTGGTEIATADYQTGAHLTTLMIIEYHTPQASTFGYDAAFNQLKGMSDVEKQRRVLKRVGNYVVEALVGGDSAGDLTAARSIVDSVKYNLVVYWEGKKFSSIPIQFRPPDPAAIEEFNETTKVLLRTFYGIGFMLAGSIILGVFAGWSVFYWRKQRRRKLGMDDYFSDAGETVRLNLDEYIFQPNEQPVKLLGKGDV